MEDKIMRVRRVPWFFSCVLLFAMAGGSFAQEHEFQYGIKSTQDTQNILPLWEQAKIMEKQLKWRQKHVLPEVMRREGFDMWLVSRNEGVIYISLSPGKHRRTG